MNRATVERRITGLIGEIQAVAGELETEATLLRMTIVCNREDVYGIVIRINVAKSKSDHLGRLSLRLDELHDLLYKLVEPPSDAERQEMIRKPGEEEGPSSGD